MFFNIFTYTYTQTLVWIRHGHDPMVVGFTTNYAISAIHH